MALGKNTSWLLAVLALELIFINLDSIAIALIMGAMLLDDHNKGGDEDEA